MAGDSSLINAAFAQYQSSYASDLTSSAKMIEAQNKIASNYMKVFNDAFKAYKVKEEKIEMGKDAQLANFKSILNTNYSKLFVQKEVMPAKIVAAIDNEVRRLQEEFETVNTYGDGDNVENERARIRINGELQRVINEAINARATFIKLSDRVEDWPEDAIKYKNLDALTAMMDLDNLDKNDNVAVSFVNGKLTFSARNYTFNNETQLMEGPMISYNISQMDSLLPGAILENDTKVVGLINSFGDEGKTAGSEVRGTSFDLNEFTAKINNIIRTPEDFRSLAMRRIPDLNEKSFYQSLKMDNLFRIDIDMLNSTLAEEFVSKLDLDPDGKIDVNDMKNLSDEDLEIYTQNYNKLIQVLTDIDYVDPNNPEIKFDLNTSKAILGDYFAGFAEGAYNTNYKANLPEGSDPMEGYEMLFGRRVPAPQGRVTLEREYALVNSIASGQDLVTVNKKVYKYNKDKKMYQLYKTQGATDPFENWQDGEFIRRESLMQQASEVYGSVDSNYFEKLD